MTKEKRKMTKEDIELRQGRSKQQYNSSLFGIKYSVIILLIGLLISLFYASGKYIDYLIAKQFMEFFSSLI